MKRFISFLLTAVMLTTVCSVVGVASGVDLTEIDLQMLDGASIRIGTVAGIRYCTAINKQQLDDLVSTNGEANVEIGTIIAPTRYVTEAGAFTMEKLDALKASKGFANDAYVKVKATYGYAFDTERINGVDYYVFAGSLENIKEQNQTLAFSGIGYVKVGNSVAYATYNHTNSRSVGYVAYRAYTDSESGLDAEDLSLIDGFANSYLSAQIGTSVPDISSIRYFEAYDEQKNSEAFTDATELLGWKDNFVYGGTAENPNTNYVYGKDVQAKHADGKLVFQTTNTARAGHNAEAEFIASNTSNVGVQDPAHSLLTIPGLDHETLFVGNNDIYVLQFDMKILSYNGDVGVGLSVCERETNFARGKMIAATDISWVFCSETDGTTNWYKHPGSIAEYCDPDAKTVRVKFVINRDLSVQQLWLGGVNIGSIFAGQGQMGEAFDLGLYLYGEGTVEIDNFLVYSYDSNADAKEVISVHQDADMRIMTLNVSLNNDEPDVRKTHILNLIQKYEPTVLCLQECNAGSYTRIVEALADRYSVAFRTHSDSDILIYTPILYRKDRVELIEGGGGWLDARYTGTNTKSYSWAVLQFKNGGKTFAVTNLHGAVTSKDYPGYENYSNEQLLQLANQWTIDNVRQLFDIIASIRQTHGNIPTLSAGDFNFNSSSEAYAAAIKGGLVEAETHATVSRCVGYRTTHTPGTAARLGASIDHIFYFYESVTAYVHYVGATTEDELAASDHLMVYADVAFEERWTDNY